MVIGETFAWGHVPKTGGDATLAMFRVFPELIVQADAPDTNDKHCPFHWREDRVRGKCLILNIRRLPAWMLSYAQHVARGGVYPDYVPLPLPAPDEIAERTVADEVLGALTDGGRIAVSTWLRTEWLRWDFLDLVAQLAEVPESRRRQIARMGMINAGQYDHDVSHWFTAQQIRRMYENNPRWAAIERQVYGALILEHPRASRTVSRRLAGQRLRVRPTIA
jgi:hypothetical protein